MIEELLQQLERHLMPDEMGHHKPDSFMEFGVICEHDDGFICEHRVAFLIEKVKNAIGWPLPPSAPLVFPQPSDDRMQFPPIKLPNEG